jgi:hypothetical protein
MDWALIVIATLLIWIALDVWCYHKNQATLSSKIREWTAKYPLFPFLIGLWFGLLGGHWWWPADSLPFGL